MIATPVLPPLLHDHTETNVRGKEGTVVVQRLFLPGQESCSAVLTRVTLSVGRELLVPRQRPSVGDCL